MVEAQEPAWQDRDRVLLVVDVRHISAQVVIHPVRKVLIPDPRHPIANHPHTHTRAELDTEVDAVEERECRTERVTDHCDGRHAVF
jgi:hypothetical protein